MTGDNQDVLEFLNQTKSMYDEDSANYRMCEQAIAAVMGVQKAAKKLSYIHQCIDLMSDDITYCYYSKCKNKKCARHPSNIRVHYIPHSFAFFKDCENWDMPETYFETSKEGEG